MLTLSQKLAKALGKKDGNHRNTWFGSDINHSDNICLKLKKDTSISLGAIKKDHLPQIVKTNIKDLMSNVFAPSLDKK